MSRQRLLQFAAHLVASWRKSRRPVLAIGVAALGRRRRLTLCGIARGLESLCRVIHRVKRIWRFRNNSGVDPREVSGALSAQAFGLRPRGGW